MSQTNLCYYSVYDCWYHRITFGSRTRILFRNDTYKTDWKEVVDCRIYQCNGGTTCGSDFCM